MWHIRLRFYRTGLTWGFSRFTCRGVISDFDCLVDQLRQAGYFVFVRGGYAAILECDTQVGSLEYAFVGL